MTGDFQVLTGLAFGGELSRTVGAFRSLPLTDCLPDRIKLQVSVGLAHEYLFVSTVHIVLALGLLTVQSCFLTAGARLPGGG